MTVVLCGPCCIRMNVTYIKASSVLAWHPNMQLARTCTVRVHTCRVLYPCCTCHALYYNAPHPMQVRQVDLPLICCRTRALSKLTSTCCTPPLSTANQCLDHLPGAAPLPPLAMLSACPFCLACPFCTCVFKVFVLLLSWSVICY